MNDAEKELLKLTVVLPKWALQGKPAPLTLAAHQQGCSCDGNYEADGIWWVNKYCVVHGAGNPNTRYVPAAQYVIYAQEYVKTILAFLRPSSDDAAPK